MPPRGAPAGAVGGRRPRGGGPTGGGRAKSAGGEGAGRHRAEGDPPEPHDGVAESLAVALDLVLAPLGEGQPETTRVGARANERRKHEDRKSTRLNSSHSQISYAVFCLKKKNKVLFLHDA